MTDADFNAEGKWQVRPHKWTINPGKIYEQKEFFDVLYHCLAELPERLAEAFMLREMDGLSTAEVCKALDITATNSWVMLYRARMSLRRCLEHEWLGAEQ
jgi:RNA polymerase sigma-70 factor (ECF subfamily)